MKRLLTLAFAGVLLAGPAQGKPVAFSGDPGDPTGIWQVDVVVRDALRNVEVPLHTQFELKAN